MTSVGQPRDLTAKDPELTDEELALVMREARDVAVQRRAKADAWIAARLGFGECPQRPFGEPALPTRPVGAPPRVASAQPPQFAALVWRGSA